MTNAALKSQSLISRLPAIRGRYSENASLAKVTWFQVGGGAEVLFKPADLADLRHFLQNKPGDIPVTILGVGSNILVRDGGVKGVVIRLGREFAQIRADSDKILAGAAALDGNVARFSQMAGIAGLEFLIGIPGTIGGALRMNAGAYGREIKDILIEAEAVDAKGNLHRLTLDDMRFTYRHCGIPRDWIFTGAVFQGAFGDGREIEKRMKDIAEQREATQPVRSRTGGSTFKNPPGQKAWELIDQAGCRGLAVGAAQVSEKHTNFLINTGGATAADLENLGEEVRRRVREKSGIELQWEIERIGDTNIPSP